MPESTSSKISVGALPSWLVVTEIASAMRDLGVQRFDMKYATGPVPHTHQMRCIELYGTRVIPRVRELLAQ